MTEQTMLAVLLRSGDLFLSGEDLLNWKRDPALPWDPPLLKQTSTQWPSFLQPEQNRSSLSGQSLSWSEEPQRLHLPSSNFSIFFFFSAKSLLSDLPFCCLDFFCCCFFLAPLLEPSPAAVAAAPFSRLFNVA